MPELPDVEALKRHLGTCGLVGRTIVAARLDWPRAVRQPDAGTFSQAVRGRRVEGLGRRAKYLLIPLDGPTLVVHLRMTGHLVIEPAETPPQPMVRNAFALDDGRELRFQDFRKLGQMWLLDDPAPLLARLGPEPLAPEFTVQALMVRLKRPVPIKPLLLEQDVLAGVGNIYADEALWCAKINPLRPAQSLASEEVERLHACLQQVLSEAIDNLEKLMPFGGPASDSPEGANALRVPRKGGSPCGRCYGPISKQTIRGRSAYFCPECQQTQTH